MMDFDQYLSETELNQIVALVSFLNAEGSTFNNLGMEINLTDANGENLGMVKPDTNGFMAYFPNQGITHYE